MELNVQFQSVLSIFYKGYVMSECIPAAPNNKGATQYTHLFLCISSGRRLTNFSMRSLYFQIHLHPSLCPLITHSVWCHRPDIHFNAAFYVELNQLLPLTFNDLSISFDLYSRQLQSSSLLGTAKLILNQKETLQKGRKQITYFYRQDPVDLVDPYTPTPVGNIFITVALGYEDQINLVEPQTRFIHGQISLIDKKNPKYTSPSLWMKAAHRHGWMSIEEIEANWIEIAKSNGWIPKNNNNNLTLQTFKQVDILKEYKTPPIGDLLTIQPSSDSRSLFKEPEQIKLELFQPEEILQILPQPKADFENKIKKPVTVMDFFPRLSYSTKYDNNEKSDSDWDILIGKYLKKNSSTKLKSFPKQKRSKSAAYNKHFLVQKSYNDIHDSVKNTKEYKKNSGNAAKLSLERNSSQFINSNNFFLGSSSTEFENNKFRQMLNNEEEESSQRFSSSDQRNLNYYQNTKYDLEEKEWSSDFFSDSVDNISNQADLELSSQDSKKTQRSKSEDPKNLQKLSLEEIVEKEMEKLSKNSKQLIQTNKNSKSIGNTNLINFNSNEAIQFSDHSPNEKHEIINNKENNVSDFISHPHSATNDIQNADNSPENSNQLEILNSHDKVKNHKKHQNSFKKTNDQIGIQSNNYLPNNRDLTTNGNSNISADNASNDIYKNDINFVDHIIDIDNNINDHIPKDHSPNYSLDKQKSPVKKVRKRRRQSKLSQNSIDNNSDIISQNNQEIDQDSIHEQEIINNVIDNSLQPQLFNFPEKVTIKKRKLIPADSPKQKSEPQKIQNFQHISSNTQNDFLKESHKAKLEIESTQSHPDLIQGNQTSFSYINPNHKYDNPDRKQLKSLMIPPTVPLISPPQSPDTQDIQKHHELISNSNHHTDNSISQIMIQRENQGKEQIYEEKQFLSPEILPERRRKTEVPFLAPLKYPHMEEEDIFQTTNDFDENNQFLTNQQVKTEQNSKQSHLKKKKLNQQKENQGQKLVHRKKHNSLQNQKKSYQIHLRNANDEQFIQRNPNEENNFISEDEQFISPNFKIEQDRSYEFQDSNHHHKEDSFHSSDIQPQKEPNSQEIHLRQPKLFPKKRRSNQPLQRRKTQHPIDHNYEQSTKNSFFQQNSDPEFSDIQHIENNDFNQHFAHTSMIDDKETHRIKHKKRQQTNYLEQDQVITDSFNQTSEEKEFHKPKKQSQKTDISPNLIEHQHKQRLKQQKNSSSADASSFKRSRKTFLPGPDISDIITNDKPPLLKIRNNDNNNRSYIPTSKSIIESKLSNTTKFTHKKKSKLSSQSTKSFNDIDDNEDSLNKTSPIIIPHLSLNSSLLDSVKNISTNEPSHILNKKKIGSQERSNSPLQFPGEDYYERNDDDFDNNNMNRNVVHSPTLINPKVKSNSNNSLQTIDLTSTSPFSSTLNNNQGSKKKVLSMQIKNANSNQNLNRNGIKNTNDNNIQTFKKTRSLKHRTSYSKNDIQNQNNGESFITDSENINTRKSLTASSIGNKSPLKREKRIPKKPLDIRTSASVDRAPLSPTSPGTPKKEIRMSPSLERMINGIDKLDIAIDMSGIESDSD